MATLDVVRRISIQATGTENLDRVKAAYDGAAEAEKRFALAAEAAGAANENAERKITSVAIKLDAYMRKTDEVYRATSNFERAAKLLATSLNQGLFGPGEQGVARFRAELARARAELDAIIAKSQSSGVVQAPGQAPWLSASGRSGWAGLSEAGRVGLANANRAEQDRIASARLGSLGGAGGAAPSAAGARNQVPPWLLAQYSIQSADVAQTLALGFSPLAVALQQGPQILGLWQQSGISLRDTFRSIGSAVSGILTPMRLVTGGAVALGAAVLASYVAWEVQNERLARSIDGIGRASGATVEDLQRVARAGAAANGLSLSTNRSLVAGYAGTGRLGTGMIEGLLGQTRTFARVSGTEVAEAGAALAKAFSDPAKGADELNASLGFLDDRTRQLIRTMSAQGDVAGAQRVLLQALSDDLDKTATRTWSVARAWEGLKSAIGGGIDAVGSGVANIVNGATFEERLAELIRQRDNPSASMTRRSVIAGEGTDGLNRTIELMQATQRQQNRLAAERSRDAIASRESIVAGDLTRQILGTQTQQDLIDRAARLRDALATPGASDRLGESLDEATKALAAAENAASTYISTDERFRQSHELTIRSIEARTAVEKAAIAAAQARLSLAGQAVTAAEAQARAEAAAAEVLARAAREAQDRQRSADDAAALAGLPSYVRSRAEIEQRARRAAEEAQGSPDALAAIAATQRAEIEALNRNTAASLTDPQSINERISAVRLLGETFGKTAGEIAKAEEMQSLLNNAARAGVPITSDLQREFSRLADAAGAAAQAQHDLVERQQQVVAGMDDLRGTTTNVLGTLARGGDVAEILKNKLIDVSSQMLSEGLLGKQGEPGGGLFGEFASKIIGSAVGLPAAEEAASGLQQITAATATINATTVVLNGGLSATGGGLSTISTKDLPPLSAVDAVNTMAGGGTLSNAAALNGVDPRLVAIMQEAANRSGFQVQATSGFRQGDPRFHGKGLAADFAIIDPVTGQPLPNYQDGASFRSYEYLAQQAKLVQMEQYPELNDRFRWGGYFSGQRGKYGALDTMHFDLGGQPGLGMAGGSWADGLTQTQRGYFPDATSIGMAGGVAQPAAQAGQALSSLANQAGQSTNALGGFGQSLMGVLQMLQGNPQGATNLVSGVGNIFSGLFSGTGTVPLPLPKPVMGAMAGGGIAGASGYYLVGENGPELVPLRVGNAVIPNHEMRGATANGASVGGGVSPLNINVRYSDHTGKGTRGTVTNARMDPNGELMLDMRIDDRIGRSRREGGHIDRELVQRGTNVRRRQSAA